LKNGYLKLIIFLLLLGINNLKKSFLSSDGSIQEVINVPSFSMESGQQIALSGTSGSGKTTLLNLIAGILQPDEGQIELSEYSMSGSSESVRDRLRAQIVGYIFQTFNLLQGYTCLENVLLGMSFGGSFDKNRAVELLGHVGLNKRLDYYPRQLSTGQQQRVAVARALANRPKLVLADEPTGNLDPANSLEALSLIRQTCSENGAALLLVSHDKAVLDQFEDVRDLFDINRAGGKVGAE
jgi:putative ABC transport system ATP-binding protein